MEITETNKYSWDRVLNWTDQEIKSQFKENKEIIIKNLTQNVPERSMQTIAIVYKILDALWCTPLFYYHNCIFDFFKYLRKNQVLDDLKESSWFLRVRKQYSKDEVLSDFVRQLLRLSHGSNRNQDMFISELVECTNEFKIYASDQTLISFPYVDSWKNYYKNPSVTQVYPIKFPLHLAIKLEFSLTEKAIRKKCKIDLLNAQDDEGNTPLHIAFRYNKIDEFAFVVLGLIRDGANINTQNLQGDTPFHTLCKKKYGNFAPKVIKWQSESLAHYCARQIKKDYDVIFSCMINSGADVLIKNKNDECVLSLSVENFIISVISFFIKKHKHDFSAKNETIKTFNDLIRLILNKYVYERKARVELPNVWHEIVLTLIRSGASLLPKEMKGLLPIVSEMSKADFEQIFLQGDTVGMTPLHHSSVLKYTDLFHFPIDLASVKNCDGVSPMDLKKFGMLTASYVRNIVITIHNIYRLDKNEVEIKRKKTIKQLEHLKDTIVVDGEEQKNSNLLLYDNFTYDLNVIYDDFKQLLQEEVTGKSSKLHLLVIVFLEKIVDRLVTANAYAQVDKLHQEKLQIRSDYFGVGHNGSISANDIIETKSVDEKEFIAMAVAFALLINFKRNLTSEINICNFFDIWSDCNILEKKDHKEILNVKILPVFNIAEFYRDLGLALSHETVMSYLRASPCSKDRFNELIRIVKSLEW